MKPLLQPTAIQSFSYSFLCAIFLIFTACNNNGEGTPDPRGRYENGVFIVNEGITAVSGSVSFWDLDSNKVTNNVYQKENPGLVQGIYTQSMYLHQDKAYICVDNAGKLIVVDNQTFKQIREISLKTPNSMVAAGNTGYVTEWIDNNFTNPSKGQVSIIDLTTGTITGNVTTDGIFPTQLVLLNNRLYVINSSDSTVAIINTQTRQLENKVVVGANPNSIVLDKNQNIWVLNSPFNGKPAKLSRFTVTNNTLAKQAEFAFERSGASRLITNATKDRLYFTYRGGVYEQSIDATTLSGAPILRRSFYGIGIDPTGNTFYGADAGNFASNGKVIRYNLATKAPIDSATVGLVPNRFVFRPL